MGETGNLAFKSEDDFETKRDAFEAGFSNAAQMWKPIANRAEALNDDLENQIAELTLGMDTFEAERDQAVADAAGLRDSLQVILPMAKGYAAEHDVGNNRRMVSGAEDTLRAEHSGDKLLSTADGGWMWINKCTKNGEACDADFPTIPCRQCIKIADAFDEALGALEEPDP